MAPLALKTDLSAKQYDYLKKVDSSAKSLLGLTISKRLAEMMGGKIWVESESGHGTTFSFTANFGLGNFFL